MKKITRSTGTFGQLRQLDRGRLVERCARQDVTAYRVDLAAGLVSIVVGFGSK